MSQQLLYAIGRWAMRGYGRFMLKMDVAYQSSLPEGAKIIALNHPTTIDPFLVTTFSSEPIHILITDSAFKVPLFGRLLLRMGHIPVVTGAGRPAFEAARRLLMEGHSIAIFPEGELSPLDGSGGRPHTGVARLALMTGAAVVPVGIALQPERIRFVNTGITNAEGNAEIARFYPRAPYAVTMGAPMRFAGDVEDREHVRVLSDTLMRRIMHLSKQGAYRLDKRAVVRTLTDTAEFPAIR